MKVRDLERYMVSLGASQSKLDVVTRGLRQEGRLPVRGPGPNAPHINATEAAAVLIALAGAGKSAAAYQRLTKLERLKSTSSSRQFGRDFAELLGNVSALNSVSQIRIARNIRRALIIYTDGSRTEYLPHGHNGYDNRFVVEAVLTRPILREVAELVQAKASYEARRPLSEEDDDA